MGQSTKLAGPAPVLRSRTRVVFPQVGVVAQLAVTGALSLGVAAASAQDIKGDAARGKDKTSMCAGCHGIPDYRASYPTVYSVPLIGGQTPKYIEAALKGYRKGERKHPTMRAIAGSLSDQDIADLAAFYGNEK